MYPKLLDLGPITVHTYGLLLAAAFIAGIWISSRNARKAGIGPDLIWNLGLVVIFSALVGGKILLLLTDFHYYSQNLREIFSLSTLRSAGAYYGGLLLALGSAAWFLLKKHLPIWIVADLAARELPLDRQSPVWDAFRQVAATENRRICPGESHSPISMPMPTSALL